MPVRMAAGNLLPTHLLHMHHQLFLGFDDLFLLLYPPEIVWLPRRQLSLCDRLRAAVAARDFLMRVSARQLRSTYCTNTTTVLQYHHHPDERHRGDWRRERRTTPRSTLLLQALNSSAEFGQHHGQQILTSRTYLQRGR